MQAGAGAWRGVAWRALTQPWVSRGGHSEPCVSQPVKCDANLSAVLCQGLTASQTQECWEILAIVWGEAEECGLPVRDTVTSQHSQGPHYHTHSPPFVVSRPFLPDRARFSQVYRLTASC